MGFSAGMLIGTIYLLLGLILFGTALAIVVPWVYGRWIAPLVSLPVMGLALFWPQVMGAGVVVTLLVGLSGGLGARVGQIGLGLHVLAWGMLLYQQRLVQGTLPVLDGKPVEDDEHPFCAGLTEDELQGLMPGQVRWRPSVTLRVPAMLEVQVERGVVFRDVCGVRLRLDVYRPGPETAAHRQGGGPLPAAVYIHGGGWITGTRRQSRFMMYELAAAGWVVFAVSYRFAPRHPLPAAIHDCKAAIAWVKQHAAEYGARGDDLLVMGGSAGGHLTAMMALTPNQPRFQPGFEDADTRVRGAVVLYGVADFERPFAEQPHAGVAAFFERLIFRARYRDDPARFREAQPVSHLSAEAPPILLVHGRNDMLVPFDESQRFYEKLVAAGARDVHLLEVPNAVHAFEVAPSPLHQRTVRVILRFMESVRRVQFGGK